MEHARVVADGIRALPAAVDAATRARGEAYLVAEATKRNVAGLGRLAAHLLHVLDPEGARPPGARGGRAGGQRGVHPGPPLRRWPRVPRAAHRAGRGVHRRRPRRAGRAPPRRGRHPGPAPGREASRGRPDGPGPDRADRPADARVRRGAGHPHRHHRARTPPRRQPERHRDPDRPRAQRRPGAADPRRVRRRMRPGRARGGPAAGRAPGGRDPALTRDHPPAQLRRVAGRRHPRRPRRGARHRPPLPDRARRRCAARSSSATAGARSPAADARPAGARRITSGTGPRAARPSWTTSSCCARTTTTSSTTTAGRFTSTRTDYPCSPHHPGSTPTKYPEPPGDHHDTSCSDTWSEHHDGDRASSFSPHLHDHVGDRNQTCSNTRPRIAAGRGSAWGTPTGAG